MSLEGKPSTLNTKVALAACQITVFPRMLITSFAEILQTKLSLLRPSALQ